jgi:hypothetical protein
MTTNLISNIYVLKTYYKQFFKTDYKLYLLYLNLTAEILFYDEKNYLNICIFYPSDAYQ